MLLWHAQIDCAVSQWGERLHVDADPTAGFSNDNHSTGSSISHYCINVVMYGDTRRHFSGLTEGYKLYTFLYRVKQYSETVALNICAPSRALHVGSVTIGNVSCNHEHLFPPPLFQTNQ
jgi:hypothetical protein